MHSHIFFSGSVTSQFENFALGRELPAWFRSCVSLGSTHRLQDPSASVRGASLWPCPTVFSPQKTKRFSLGLSMRGTAVADAFQKRESRDSTAPFRGGGARAAGARGFLRARLKLIARRKSKAMMTA